MTPAIAWDNTRYNHKQRDLSPSALTSPAALSAPTQLSGSAQTPESTARPLFRPTPIAETIAATMSGLPSPTSPSPSSAVHPLKYAYFPGCIAQGACRELYQSTAALTEALGIELVELKQASCCGSGTFKEESLLLEDTVNARNIALAESLNLPLLTHCSTCQGTLGRVDERLKEAQFHDSRYLSTVNGYLREQGCTPYRGTTEVKHLLWALVADYGLEEIERRVSRRLAGLNCGAFYGCYLLRVQKHMPYDNPKAPAAMENLFRAVGATPIDYPGRTQCCGWPISSYAQTESFAMAGGHLQAAIAAGADCLVTPCPLCHLNLDSRQPEIAKQLGVPLNLPVLHLSQLVALAIGVDPDRLGLDRHLVSPLPLLERLGLL